MGNLELYKDICEMMPSNTSLEDSDNIIIDGVEYTFNEIESLTTEDEGKYQYGGSIYGVGIASKDKSWKIDGEPLFYVEQDFTQTGSYYSHQEREYEKPYIVEKKEVVKTVWKKI